MIRRKKIIVLLLLFILFNLAGCQNVSQEENPDTIQLGNLDNVETSDVYVDSKDNVTVVEPGVEPTKGEGYPPVTYLSIEDVPESTYAIEHTNDDGSTVYYRLYDAWGGHATYDNRGNVKEYILNIFGVGERREGAYSVDTTRFCWVKNGYDESCIPTMYATDKLIYKSANAITEGFAIERFSDEGYTIGLAGLKKSGSGNYIYTPVSGYTEPDSDTINIDNLGASEIYVVAVGSERVNDDNVSPTGFITGLEKNKNYICDIRTGTVRKQAAFRADIHIFVSLEQFMTSKFFFSHPLYIEIPFENSVPTGYYSINGAGLFRYVAAKDMDKAEELIASDWNIPFIKLDSEGNLISTVDGYALDEYGYITKADDGLHGGRTSTNDTENSQEGMYTEPAESDTITDVDNNSGTKMHE